MSKGVKGCQSTAKQAIMIGINKPLIFNNRKY